MTVDPIRGALRMSLKDAMRARDKTAIAAIRSALAAIDNAEVVSVEAPSTSAGDSPIAGATLGLGATEAPRRQLSEQEVATIVDSEISGRLAAATEVEQAGRADHSERLRAEAAVLESFVRP